MRYKRYLSALFIGICIIGASYAGYGLFHARNAYDTADRRYKVLQELRKDYKTEENTDSFTEAMQEINPDYMAWIEVEGTSIDYPIVQADEKYLNRDFYGNDSVSGSLFVNGSQEPFKDLNTIIFGHNMKDGSMFSGLKNYLHKTWFENHSIIKIQYKGQSLSYKVFSVNILPEEDTASYVYQFNNREYEDFLKELLLNSMIDSGVEIHDAPIITLSTCYGTGKRLIIAAQEVN